MKNEESGPGFAGTVFGPNLGAFLAWGLIAALFVKAGWVDAAAPQPADGLVAAIGGWGVYAGQGIVGSGLTYLLPLLIGYAAGRVVHGARGGAVGAVATLGVVAGSGVPMWLGALAAGWFAGVSLQRLDRLATRPTAAGSGPAQTALAAGWAAVLAVSGFLVAGPLMSAAAALTAAGVGWLAAAGLLPLAPLLVEPARLLFLSEGLPADLLANPGPGLGLLLAYAVFGRGPARAGAPAAAVIQFLGGIAPVCFPFVWMRPVLILALIAGGLSGSLVNLLFGVALPGSAGPVSVFAVYAQAADGSQLALTVSVLSAAAVTMAVAAVLLPKRGWRGERAATASAPAVAEPAADLPGPVARAVEQPAETVREVLPAASIVLAGTATDRAGAIEEAGQLLVRAGAVLPGYVAAMHERERAVSTYLGNLLAIPHGTNEAKSLIRESAVSVVRYPQGIDWNGNEVRFVVAIAGVDDDHLDLLARIAEVFLDADAVAALEAADTVAAVAGIFAKVNA